MSPIDDIAATQQTLFDDMTPAQRWDEETTKGALDDLFDSACQYRSSDNYRNLLEFVARFHFYSPYNAMLVYLQMPGARFVATPKNWKKKYGRSLKPNARPIVMLQPKGPVMFVFDVSDTKETPYSVSLPRGVVDPFAIRSGNVGSKLKQTIENAKRDGIRIWFRKEGSQSAGSIRAVNGSGIRPLLFRSGNNSEEEQIRVRYELLLNENLSKEARYATIAHELAHVYCGHIGTPDPKWWPDRRGLTQETQEFEAESVAYLLCKRLGIDSPSAEYLGGYLKRNEEIPNISFERVMKVSVQIEKMGKERLKPRR